MQIKNQKDLIRKLQGKSGASQDVEVRSRCTTSMDSIQNNRRAEKPPCPCKNQKDLGEYVKDISRSLTHIIEVSCSVKSKVRLFKWNIFLQPKPPCKTYSDEDVAMVSKFLKNAL